MSTISESEFSRICDGIYEDRETICKHNPIGTPEETILWMLLSVLISYLSLDGNSIPCFPNSTTTETYRQAIDFILADRKTEHFEIGPYLEQFSR